jgi:hypothetical protein
MNIHDKVCSLELSRRLQELGFKQESIFYWGEILTGRHAETEFNIFYYSIPVHNIITEYSSFTASELLKILPHRVTLPEGGPYNSFRLRMEKGVWVQDLQNSTHANIRTSEFYSVNYYCDTTSQEMCWMFPCLTKNISDENLANALAEMLIYLCEEGLIKNERI